MEKKKGYIRKKCVRCGKKRKKKFMRFDKVKKEWICEDCDFYRDIGYTLDLKLKKSRTSESNYNEIKHYVKKSKTSYKRMMEMMDVYDSMRKDGIKTKMCPLCKKPMVRKEGYYKCTSCGIFTRSEV